MKAIIILNGEPYAGGIDTQNAYVLCADGGYNWAKNRLKIDETIGDLDSVKEPPIPAPQRVYPSEKDQTDGELAVERVLQLASQGKVDSVELYGVGGGREDHFLGNFHLLYRLAQAGLPCVGHTNKSDVFAFTKQLSLHGLQGATVSLLPFGGEIVVKKTQGFYYPADGVTLGYGICRGISNRIVAEQATVQLQSGVALCIVNK